MKIISKEKSWFGFDIDGKLYCFEEINDNYRYSGYNEYKIKFLSDITVNEHNQVHSFNDQPALIFKGLFNRIVKIWLINGLHKRSNPEKPYKIIKGYACFFNNGNCFSKEEIKENLK